LIKPKQPTQGKHIMKTEITVNLAGTISGFMGKARKPFSILNNGSKLDLDGYVMGNVQTVASNRFQGVYKTKTGLFMGVSLIDDEIEIVSINKKLGESLTIITEEERQPSIESQFNDIEAATVADLPNAAPMVYQSNGNYFEAMLQLEHSRRVCSVFVNIEKQLVKVIEQKTGKTCLLPLQPAGGVKASLKAKAEGYGLTFLIFAPKSDGLFIVSIEQDAKAVQAVSQLCEAMDDMKNVQKQCSTSHEQADMTAHGRPDTSDDALAEEVRATNALNE